MSGEVKHTEGPWELVSLSGYGGPYSIRMPYTSGHPNAPKTHYGVQSIRTRGDALLIVASLDLLDAAKLALPALEDEASSRKPDDPIRVAAYALRTAIAKAEGRQ